MNEHEFELIILQEDGAALEGYKVLSSGEQLTNWFQKRDLNPPKYDSPIMLGFLNNLFVDEEYRNEGQGTYLVESFLDECFDCQYIFLECDNGEQNEFDLKSWYEGFGFEVFIFKDNPIMILSKVEN